MKQVLATLILALLGLSAYAQTEGTSANFVPDMVTDPQLCPTPGAVTNNQSIYGLTGILNRQMAEMATSVSAQQPTVTAPDMVRIESYIAEIKEYQSQINASAPMDYAGTHRLYYCLLKLEQEGPVVTSQAILDLLTQWTLMAGELYTSTSSRMPSGLAVPDNARLTSQITAAENYVLYLKNTTPKDYPRTNAITTHIEDTAGIARKQ